MREYAPAAAGPVERSDEDEEKRKRFNASAAKWRQFWRRAKPRVAPVPSFTAQAFHLLSISAGVTAVDPTLCNA